MRRAQESRGRLYMARASFRLGVDRRSQPHEVHSIQELLGLLVESSQFFGQIKLLPTKAVQEGRQDPAPQLLLGFLAGVGGAEGYHHLLGGGEDLAFCAEDDCFHMREKIKGFSTG